MELQSYVIKQNKRLRRGYTTGSCAAAAAGAAARTLLTGADVPAIELLTPAGIRLTLEVEDMRRGEGFASCAVRKDGGDDPDATNGLLVYARVEKAEGTARVLIDGGEGVGRVTLPGLDQPVGAAAINRVPRQMIREAVLAECEAAGFSGALRVLISVPGGQQTAEKTFNPRLGIKGGISILGTTGIVEPMSEDALIKSIEVEMKVRLSGKNKNLVVIPGNYGAVFSENELGLSPETCMKCSNYVGETVDMAVALGAESLLFIAHIGKFIKVSGGIMNTHSRNSDSRMELLAAAALRAGAPLGVLEEILKAPTTDEGLRLLKEAGFLKAAMETVMEKISFYLAHRSGGAIPTEAMVFSNVYGLLGKTKGADALLKKAAADGGKHE